MKNLGELYDYLSVVLNKAQLSGNISPAEFNAVLPGANEAYYNEVRKLYEANAASEDNSRVVVKTRGDEVYPPIVFTNGVCDLPTDYRSKSSLVYLKQTNIKDADCGDDERIKVKEVVVEWVPDNVWAERSQSKLTPPTLKYPIWTVQNNKMIIRPKKVKVCRFTYFRTLNTPFYDYTVVNYANVFLPTTGTHDGSVLTGGTPSRTVEIEWNNYYKFGAHVLIALGVQKRINEVVALGQQMMQESKSQENA